jgi:hypothetical protein
MARHEWMRPPNRDPGYLVVCVRRAIARAERRPNTNSGLLGSLWRMEKVYARRA